ncbi:MAG: class I SAM-dependent methyltransferase [Rhodospirillaceae bacterium]|jgi:hypothetical protein|nr:class I SAM-dependent methyltransferase [Rhodospirillaceae bacterium]
MAPRWPEALDVALKIDEGSIADLVNIFYVNKRRFDMSPGQIAVSGTLRKLKRFQQHNPIARSRANAEAHYNIGNDLYRLFLDEDMQYSCAFFPTGNETLEEAQRLKKELIACKLRLEPGMRVLDIGCGWGGLAMTLAETADVEVVGVSLASEQLDLARQRAAERGLADRVRFELQDYREVAGSFGRHARTCRGAASPGVFPEPARPACARRCRAGPLDRDQGAAGHHRAVHSQVHLSWRLFAGDQRGLWRTREIWPVATRRRSPAPPLRADPGTLGRAFRRAPR